MSDLAGYAAQWVSPVSVRFRTHRVWSLPPNVQEVIALQALGIIDRLGTDADPGRRLHYQIEAMKTAFVDGEALIGDPAAMTVDAGDLLDPSRLAAQAARNGPTATTTTHRHTARGGTVYIATADRAGGFVSLIQSNYLKFDRVWWSLEPG